MLSLPHSSASHIKCGTENGIEMTLALPGGKEMNSDIKTMKENKRILWMSITVRGLDVCPFDGRWKRRGRAGGRADPAKPRKKGS